MSVSVSLCVFWYYAHSVGEGGPVGASVAAFTSGGGRPRCNE